ncbi:Receptor-type guanylate cyclase gcy [Seminavis robusta]|uniref:Receptor-type guanylate cyclase gcy n=1 Tax=Seminavis robusta TaxID=568900 RepID=A0A9N8HID8_9STRA|nr:Receptor-type guanylate cyclase gcy [Seminavis robusta]|eukprot:Sro775_g200850.1 Receptor-type guanylate cyclase gcy (1217) ;mRNA; r:38717-43284
MGILKHYPSQDLDMSTTDFTESSGGERDEILEVRKQSHRETARVRMWRILVTLALLATAVAVTVTTYVLLVDREDQNFRNVFDQFSRTVGDAAIEQQANLREALRMMADSMALLGAAHSVNGTSPWPYFIPEHYEQLALDFKLIARAEFISMQNYVTHEQRDSYIDFITPRYQDFVQDAHMIAYGNLDNLNNDTSKYQPYIAQKLKNGSFVPEEDHPYYFARNVQSPPARKYGPTINNNLLANKIISDGFHAIMSLQTERAVMTNIKPFANLPEDEHKKMHSSPDGAKNPHSFTFSPVHRIAGDETSDIVAMFALATAWDVSMLNLLPSNVKGMITVISNTCNQTVTYRIDGADAWYLGEGDLHTDYDDMGVYVDLNLQTHPDARSTPGHCMYSMTIYPSKAFEDDYKTSTPGIFAAVVAGTFLMVAVVYFIYDTTVQNRNEMMINNAAQSNAIVSSFVPDHLRDRILQDKKERQAGGFKKHGSLKMFLNDGKGGNVDAGRPLADLFLNSTVLFADISGFTAWSSVREPSQVFTLLETLFQAFDKVAKKRRIFKVETVGDCYVAVSGLPDPRPDHAVAMARFGRDILAKMRVLTKELEVVLGPDTGDLELRIGMHSGPVTAGVLRGERTRFQLFGDTMNTCSRLESSSERGRIHCSKETADHIIKDGNGHWIHKRTDNIAAKGKGSLETFWVIVEGERAATIASAVSSNEMVTTSKFAPSVPFLDERTNRLIDWNVEMLLHLLKPIVARRTPANAPKKGSSKKGASSSCETTGVKLGATPLEEVREIITLPEFDEKAEQEQQQPEEVEIPQEVEQQLHHLVSKIASMYNNNPFHNFDHASHVVMSVIKLMSRIVAPSHLDEDAADKALHDHTYGITSDPLTQFACTFSALIHDVDHVGVSNAQLVKEEVPLVDRYGERSVAEQNSLDLSWDLLMDPTYDTLRAFLFPTKCDMVRFRQLVVNSVMSTDIVDKEMKKLRNDRWDKAFKNGDNANFVDENPRDEVNRKATIVIEHIIQASDISHTMQHWHVYRKWNQNLFEELYVAYLNGRTAKDPAEFWYKGEFGFFDFYIIPLTQKLRDCGVFGVSSGEYLDYATKNRAEWEAHGEEAVAQMIKEAREKYGVPGDIKEAALQVNRMPRPMRELSQPLEAAAASASVEVSEQALPMKKPKSSIPSPPPPRVSWGSPEASIPPPPPPRVSWGSASVSNFNKVVETQIEC